MNTNIEGDFQICISVLLKERAFLLSFWLYVVIHPRGILIIKEIIFAGYIVSKIFIRTWSKAKTWSWTVLLRKIKSQLTTSSPFLIAVTSTLLQFQTRRSYEDQKTIFKFKLQWVTWWRQLICKKEWTLLSVTKLGWSIKIRSMQEED